MSDKLNVFDIAGHVIPHKQATLHLVFGHFGITKATPEHYIYAGTYSSKDGYRLNWELTSMENAKDEERKLMTDAMKDLVIVKFGYFNDLEKYIPNAKEKLLASLTAAKLSDNIKNYKQRR